jgi:hypothetical protein
MTGWGERLPLARQHRRNDRMSGRLCHFERRFTLVDPRAQVGICAAVEKRLDGDRIALSDGHVERRVVIDPALIRVRAKRKQQPNDASPQSAPAADSPADVAANCDR